MKDSLLANNLNFILNINVRSYERVFNQIFCINSSQSYKLENIWFDDNNLTFLLHDYRCVTANNNIANINNEMSNTSLSQMFEDRKLNKDTYLFEKNYGNKSVEYLTVISNNGQLF